MKTLLIILMAFAGAEAVGAQEFANVEYLCADWGPAMTLPSKPGEKPQLSDTKEEVYFLKQVGRFTRKHRLLPDLFSGTHIEDVGHGISIYLCKMKPDGSAKAEIKELWHNPNHPIGTQGPSTWTDVNEKTRKIVLSVLYAGTDVMGLWTMNLDGSGLKRVLKPEWSGRLTGVDHPSWTPDGKWIVFEEVMRGMHPEQFNIAICDANGGSVKRLFEATDKIEYRQPSVSPDGKQIAFARYPNGYPGGRHLWLANIDGSNAHPLPNPNDRRHIHGGDGPAWSPDGKRIFAVSAGIVEVSTGKQLLYERPVVQNWPELNGRHANVVMPHWGKLGLLCSGWGGGIQLADERLEKLWILASSDIEDVK